MSALQNTPAITPEIVAEHGLTPDEYQTVLDIMDREPNMTELRGSFPSCGRSTAPTSRRANG